jgi:cytochrome P450
VVESAIRNPLLVGGRGTRALRPVVGERAMIVQDGADHRAHRALVAPFFSAAAIARYDPIVAEEADRRLTRIHAGEAFSALRVFHEINLAAIVRIAFGELPRARRDRLVGLIDRYGESFRSPWPLFVRPLHVALGRMNTWGRFTHNRSALRGALDAEMHAANRGTFAAALEDAVRSRTLAAEEGVDALLEILLFGHDTAAAALAWWAGHLHAHPAALERARAEIAAQAHEGGSAFLRATLHESMRLAPVVVHLTRSATDRTELGGNPIEAGEHVFLSAYLAHRDPRRFERPEAFRPERFLAPGQKASGFDYFPFGLGSRLCAGMAFAMRQMEIVATRFVARGPFRLAPGQTLAPERRLVLIVPANGLRMECAA